MSAEELNAITARTRHYALTQATKGMATLHHVATSPGRASDGDTSDVHRPIITVGPSSMRTTRPNQAY